MLNIAWPLVVFVCAFLTFEVTMGLIVMAVPNRKHHQGWSNADKRKVRRIIIGALAFWPIVLTTLGVHLYLQGIPVLLYNLTLAAGLGFFLYRLTHKRKRKSLVAQGHCPFCHYDLVGSAHATHCPECGEPIPDHTRQAAQQRAAHHTPHPQTPSA